MKKMITLFAIMCLIICSFNVTAQNIIEIVEDNEIEPNNEIVEIDYSYLEDMSVKELKDLRDAINKILGDSGDSSNFSEYGTLSGTLTYYYNDYRGNVPDTDSSVILVSKELRNANIDTSGLLNFRISGKHMDEKWGDGIYFAHVGGTGTYSIGHIPAGEYIALLVSGQTNTKRWFDNTKDGSTNPDYYRGIASVFNEYLDSDDVFAIGEAVSYNSYAYKNVTIYGGEITTLDYDFGMTYA